MSNEILAEVREIRREIREFRDNVYEQNLITKVEITKLKGNSKLWGAVGGAITTLSTGLVAVLIWLFKIK